MRYIDAISNPIVQSNAITLELIEKRINKKSNAYLKAHLKLCEKKKKKYSFIYAKDDRIFLKN